MPEISIIIPFKNGEKYLKRCIKNIEEQKYKDWELILVDDGSTDNSKKIVENYKDKKKIKYYYIEDNTIGVGKARNYGIEKASGRYIMFVDVDDYINKELLYNLEIYMKQDIELIKYKMKILEEKDTYKISNKLIKQENIEKINGQDCFNKICFYDKYLDSPCLYLIKKDIFTKKGLKFSENTFHEDFGLIPQIVVVAESIILTEYYGYYYIQTPNSIMRNSDYNKSVQKVKDKFIHYENMIKNIERFNLQEKTKQNIKLYYTNSIILSLADLNKVDRKNMERKMKKMHLINNIKINNFKQLIKKCILRLNMEMYLKMKKIL